jgi:LuxR family transcriptional regulator, glucitol operon activator
MSATRNTCFAILSAIEVDLRSFVRREAEANQASSFLPEDVLQNARRRWQADNKSQTVDTCADDSDLLDYADFGDLAKILSGKRAPFNNANQSILDCADEAVLRLSPIRNRICHSRPLEPEDFPICIDFARDLAARPEVSLPTLRSTLQRLEREPSYVLHLQIPRFWQSDVLRVDNNLPIPEFDDTGFLGRAADRQNVARLLCSHYPVVTIVGEGGIGKTALALRCLYDLIEMPDQPYDTVVWCSLKMTALTQEGVVQINADIASSLGLFRSMASTLGAPAPDSLKMEDARQELLEYLSAYRILLVIDNLETLAASELREFILQIPKGSKLLLTSRVGLGEFEVRYVLDAMESGAAAALMRKFARVLGLAEISKQDDGRLRHYCKELFYNPLLIKWFVAGVARGLDPQSLLNRDGGGLSQALGFCFANLFDKLSNSERKVVDAIASARRSVSSAEIFYLLGDLPREEIDWALSTLHNSSIVRRTVTQTDACLYQLSDSARAYLAKSSPPTPQFFADIQERLRQLRRMIEEEQVLQAGYSYEVFSVRTHSRDERIAAVYLRRALGFLDNGNFESAVGAVDEAKRILPSYSEVWRISSLVEGNRHDYYRATADLDHAVELDPHSTIVRYTYAQFLMKSMEDWSAALDQICAAEMDDPGAAAIRSAKALALVRLGRYEEAAPIYEALLNDLGGRPKRWRVATFDQAADCYRRWAERDNRNRDRESFSVHVSRAFDIIFCAVNSGDSDNRMRQRAGRTLSLALWFSSFGPDSELAMHCLNAVANLVPFFPEKCITIPDIAKYRAAFVDYPDVCARMDDLVSPFDPLVRAEVKRRGVLPTGPVGEVRRGAVVSAQMEKGYAFIEDEAGQHWFFHRSEFAADSDWSTVRVGMRVVFAVGTNDRGPCAIQVRPT